jgi:hypothetical protein
VLESKPVLLHLRRAHIESIDMAIHRIASGFGFVTVRVVHGRIAGYDVQESIRVIDELVGQGSPKANIA